jgi:hypothetical protein
MGFGCCDVIGGGRPGLWWLVLMWDAGVEQGVGIPLATKDPVNRFMTFLSLEIYFYVSIMLSSF